MTETHERFDIVLPVHNEAETIELTLREIYEEVGRKIPSRIIVAEDGSTDGTKEILKKLSSEMPLDLILSDERKGYMGGVKDGLRKSSSEIVFFIDSDGQYAPSDFWKLYAVKDKFDMVVGRKINRKDPQHRIIMALAFNLILRVLFRIPIHDADTGLRLIHRRVIENVLEDTVVLPYSFWAEFTTRATKKGFRVGEAPISHRDRIAGGTKLYSKKKLPKIISMQLRGLTRLFRELNTKRSVM